MMGPKNSTLSTAKTPKGGSTPKNDSTHLPAPKNPTEKDNKTITIKPSPIKQSLQTDEKKQSKTNSTPVQTKDDMNAFDDLSPPDLEGSSEESSSSNRTNEEMKALFRGNFGRVRTQQVTFFLSISSFYSVSTIIYICLMYGFMHNSVFS
uniref:Uncharacterized protein n=1 Tax=Parascaris univalens TaxID=6257 RepID=A0A915AQK7_PARUN